MRVGVFGRSAFFALRGRSSTSYAGRASLRVKTIQEIFPIIRTTLESNKLVCQNIAVSTSFTLSPDQIAGSPLLPIPLPETLVMGRF